jgi:hypothetical protein
MVCRLFGFSARMNKRDRLELVTCGRIKETFPSDCQRTQGMIDQGMPVPHMSGTTMKLMSIDPVLSEDRLPINLAFRRALERIAFLFDMSQQI